MYRITGLLNCPVYLNLFVFDKFLKKRTGEIRINFGKNFIQTLPSCVYCTSNDSSCTVLGLLFILQFSSENQRKIFFLVIKKHSNDQCDCRKCYINICDIKNRKIDQAEIKEINDIVMYYTVNQVSCRPCKDSDGYDIQRKKTAVQGNSLISQ